MVRPYYNGMILEMVKSVMEKKGWVQKVQCLPLYFIEIADIET